MHSTCSNILVTSFPLLLSATAQANAGPEVSSLASLLLAVGRYNSLEAAYVNSRMALISGIWDEAAALLASGTAAAPAGGTGAAAGSGAGGLGGGWLLLLYNNLMALLEGDAAWLASCLPGQQRQLLVAVTTAAFEKVRRLLPSIRACLQPLIGLEVAGFAAAYAPALECQCFGVNFCCVDACNRCCRAVEQTGDGCVPLTELVMLVLCFTPCISCI